MGSGARIETLSEHFNDWNWQKTLGIKALDTIVQELDDLKTSIGPEATAELEQRYHAAGGEQFLEDPIRLKWLSRNDLFARMRDLESASKGSVPGAGSDQDTLHVDLICRALRLESMQAKLCQRANDIVKLKNPSSTLKDRIKTLADELRAGLSAHYELLFEVAPKLEQFASAMDLPTRDEILLPTRLSPEEVIRYGVTDLLATEIQLRVCHLYITIKDLKNALGLQSFWTRYVHAQHSSQTKKTKGQSSLQASCARVRETARAYTVCYEWLNKRAPHTAEKFGLQTLRNSDLVLLSAWREKRGYKRPNIRLPWIWTLRPMQTFDILGSASQDDEEEDITMEMEPKELSPLEKVVEDWRNEFVRLDFVHTLAATERYTEEVRILSREMPATCRSFRNSALVWARRADSRVTEAVEDSGEGSTDANWAALSPAIRGYVAYASRQFDLYATLTTEAMGAFSKVVGSTAWEDIWLAPQAKDLALPEPGAT
ncbi:hypothetical protein FRC04_006083 [Tulasnella sp. 424]|nr:hypothetical protein FRC04_006083 [Tulasnella sp. 424]